MDTKADVTETSETSETIGSTATMDTLTTAVDGPSFGGYLSTVLAERQLTPRDLASLLELDLSLVYKWLRGERTPRFNSGHADRIAQALQLPPKRAPDPVPKPGALLARTTCAAHSSRPTRPLRQRASGLLD